MPIHGINHVNIRTPEYQRTIDFLRDALGLQVLPVSGYTSIEKAAWICDEDGNDLLHLASADVPYSSAEQLPDPAPRGSGAVHHIAFSCSDYDAMRSRLVALNVAFRENTVERLNIRQIFVEDPVGISFELNFSSV